MNLEREQTAARCGNETIDGTGGDRSPMSRISLVVLLLLAGCAANPMAGQSSMNPAHDTSAGPLVGTWRAIRYQTWNDAGDVSTPLGDPVSGYAVFDGTGHAFIHLMRMPPAAASGPAPEEIRASYAGYYGTYTVDAAGGTVTIAVEGSNLPGYIGSVQVRPFRIAGDTLQLGVPGKYQATLVRLRPGAGN